MASTRHLQWAVLVGVLTACQRSHQLDSDASLEPRCAPRAEIIGVTADPESPCELGQPIVVGCVTYDIHSTAVGCYTSSDASQTVTTDSLYYELLEQGWTHCTEDVSRAVFNATCD